MQYRLICSDIDGTLLNKDRQLSQRTIDVIHKIKEGTPFVLISSRMPKAMRHLQADLNIENQPLIAYNGGLILDNSSKEENTILSIEIPIHITMAIVMFNIDLKLHTSLYHNDEWYVPSLDYWAKREWNNTKVEPQPADLKFICEEWKNKELGAHKIMCMGEPQAIDQLVNFLNINFKEELHAYRSKDTYLEIASKKISKLSALSYLLDNKYDFKLNEVIAFGDNYNDVEMIDGVGYGVAVANAKLEVKAVANELTQKNIDDGVALVLESLLIQYAK